jgi:hypothetical protein
MLDHHIQREIVYRLAFSDGLRFSELKPDELESKLFTYHLKKVSSAGFVEKRDDGLYQLTAEGRRVGVGAFRDYHMTIDRAYSILIMAIRRKSDGAWLFYRRRTHPLKDYAGFMHAAPHAEFDALTMAQREVKAKTGLDGDFTVIGSGFFRFFEGDELESFTHFTFLKCDDIQGELNAQSELADYFWEKDPDFESADLFPNMAVLHDMYTGEAKRFVERTFYLSADGS